MFPANQTISPKVPTSFRNLGPRPPPFQAHQPLKIAAICTNSALKILYFDEVVFLWLRVISWTIVAKFTHPATVFQTSFITHSLRRAKTALGKGCPASANTSRSWYRCARKSAQAKEKSPSLSAEGFGPSGESRTHGLLNPIQARYQTALHPDIAAGYQRQIIL